MAKTTKVKIMIAAGGTGGHVFPGVAIAKAIGNIHPQTEIWFVGTRRGLEVTILPKLGFPLLLIRSSSIKDRNLTGRIRAMALIPCSVLHAACLIMKTGPKLLVSIGGYAAGPFSIAAWILRVPIVVVEPNAIAGFTNRFVGKFARRVFTAFEDARRYFPVNKVILSGNPVREEVLAVRREEFVQKDKMTVFVFGGSRGAKRLNEAMTGAIPRLEKYNDRIKIIHQAGADNEAALIERVYKEAGFEAVVFGFSDRIWECYKDADIVISRSGATTVAELLALGIPAILVPYPFAADDHQKANAKGMMRFGGAVMILDEECTGERLAIEIKTFADRLQILVAMKAALKAAGRPKAAETIVEESWKLVKP